MNSLNNNIINNYKLIDYKLIDYKLIDYIKLHNINIINKIYSYLIYNNYILKKSNISIDRQLLYFINRDNFSEVIKIIINNKKNSYSSHLDITLTIPLKKTNYEYSTKFNNLDRVWSYLNYHISNNI
tara:strand:+ start:251 stop:631 length:381 start_codon:yes stop_codon:yes gene_type:complete